MASIGRVVGFSLPSCVNINWKSEMIISDDDDDDDDAIDDGGTAAVLGWTCSSRAS